MGLTENLDWFLNQATEGGALYASDRMSLQLISTFLSGNMADKASSVCLSGSQALVYRSSTQFHLHTYATKLQDYQTECMAADAFFSCRSNIVASEVRLTRDSYIVYASTTDQHRHRHQSRQMISGAQLCGP